MTGVQEAAGRILAEGDGSGMEPSLHVKRTVLEDDADKLEKYQRGGEALELAGVGRPQEAADVVAQEKLGSFLRECIHLLIGLCYTIHGMSLQFRVLGLVA